MNNVNVAIIGVGNCASSLVQGVNMFKRCDKDLFIGIMHDLIGPYGIADIQFVAAFDIDVRKVGIDLSNAIYCEPNNTVELDERRENPRMGVHVDRGMTHDGIGKYTKDLISVAPGSTADVAGILKKTKTHVVVNYLPVGSEEATKWYVEHVLQAGCAFVNCMPVFIASDKTNYWPGRFFDAGLPVIGDDVKSQLGATITHRVLTKLFEDRGMKLDRTYQLNFGGNTDFLNMLEQERLKSKKISKTQSVQSQLADPLEAKNIHVGPSDYVPWLKDRKWCYIRMEGRGFGGTPINLELKLEVHDSPNSAGVVVDAIRCAKLALDRGLKGPVNAPSSYFMKSPPVQCSDDDARQAVENFIIGTHIG